MEHFLQVAVDAAKLAGKIIADNFHAEIKNIEYKGPVDLMKETDKACEDLIFEHIARIFPDHKLIGEETTSLSGPFELTEAPTWIIDPLDGTTNFVHSMGSALLPSGVGSKQDKVTVDAATNRINSLLFKVQSLRMTGSCVLNLCRIACGRLDIFYHLSYGGLWDVAAGVVIIQEAGGMVFSPPSGEAFDIRSQRIAASNGYLKDSLVEALKESELL